MMMQSILILAILAYLLFLSKIVLRVLAEKGSPSRTLAWVLTLVTIPILGIFFYYLFGENQRKEKLFRKKKHKDGTHLDTLLQKQYLDFDESQVAQEEVIQKNKKLIKLLIKNGNALLTEGNQVTILNDGAITYDSIYEAIQTATSYIHIQYYILEDGAVANHLFDLMAEKVRTGVKVRIIYDAVGSWPLSNAYIEKCKKAGIEIFPFMPVRFGYIANKINYRNHRKIVIVDGKIGFTGGINISDKYLDGSATDTNWRDTHLRLSGPAVSRLNLIFLNDWEFVSQQKVSYPPMQKHDTKQAGVPVQIISSGPDSTYANIRQEYFALINSAESYIYITTPYFIPGETIMFALKTAALSGIDVALLLPQKLDSKILKWGINSYVEELLMAGVRIYSYEKSFLHSKVMIADDRVVSIGTANVDERSFESNFEVNALIYDRDTCMEMKRYFLEDLKDSEELKLEAFQQRPWRDKFMESTARLLSPLL